MSLKLFVTGTDTGVGKTYTSVGILKAFQQMGLTTLGLKPIASGCFKSDDKFYNEDALALQQASSQKLDYDEINPYAFEQAIAPHIAAKNQQQVLEVKSLICKMQKVMCAADVVLVEGAGGWYVPLNESESFADFVKASNLPVLLVVGLRVGCINHAILTTIAIRSMGLKVVGWVANEFTPDVAETDEIILTLQRWLDAPFLGKVGFNNHPQTALNLKYLSF